MLGAGAAGSLLGGLVYSFGGFIVTWTELPSLIETAVWLPAGLLGVEAIFRRSRLWGGMVLAGALGMSLLAGHLQIAAYVWLVAAGAGLAHVAHRLWMRRETLQPMLTLVAAFLLGAGLGAVQALPTLELGAVTTGWRRTERGGLPVPPGAGDGTGGADHYRRPRLPGESGDRDYPGNQLPEHCAFIGVAGFVGVLLALLVGRRRWPCGSTRSSGAGAMGIAAARRHTCTTI